MRRNDFYIHFIPRYTSMHHGEVAVPVARAHIRHRTRSSGGGGAPLAPVTCRMSYQLSRGHRWWRRSQLLIDKTSGPQVADTLTYVNERPKKPAN